MTDPDETPTGRYHAVHVELRDLDAKVDGHALTLAGLEGMRRVVVVLGVALLGAVAGWVTTAIDTHARIEHLERAFYDHASQPAHPGTTSMIGDLRGDLRVLTEQVRQTNAGVQDVRERVQRIEARRR